MINKYNKKYGDFDSTNQVIIIIDSKQIDGLRKK